ncbi:hypothetical protein [Terriglobus sp. TAA 43]|uniref:hypothetical protein n=1 Tax=Terriglobus sp. TAA 43 TaxID=278961 RepID=UPI0006467083
MTINSISDINQLSQETVEIQAHRAEDAWIKLLSDKHLKLKHLSLSGSDSLTDHSIALLSNLTTLESIDISYCNQITDAALNTFSSLPQLRSLVLDSCYQITDVGLQILSGSRSLSKLSLRNCEEITDEGVLALARLPHLEELILPEFANLSDASLRSLAMSALHLKVLRLSMLNAITDDGLSYLYKIKGLTSLSIDNCPNISPEAVSALQLELPNCLVSYDRVI